MKAIIFILYTDSIHKYTLADEMGKCLNLLNEQIQFCELLDTHESGQIVDKLYYSLGIQQVPSIQEVLLDSAFALMLNGTFPTWVSELLEKTKDKTDFRITSMMCKGLIDNMSSSCMSSYMKTD
ncbi:hypothetical protein PHYBLDRAFT_159616 [Phycomyces blakesleeanus NRRL 1555(-)]|uniref:Uncharacterized protein n=1 Tax=Phycomyces blakesleeanus (strain ATCC 8743b / DSM 1359 / FGSC 10004 / NBRC 33097 / NRRL 1555) TaxID=763407 RepID=A0A162TVR8_PHYB8|nr:hypothetical protein PHYBLDRAFT_159616 [Phycomyces blakesleeanus NRRL 1555(-)]OAD70213.1 hypothetical protein PHYBLDRAFT_159616 [Phycomyces blakesleeanus NRRL 1555(-)]|eukprot:XP_018288253.1 hypothetical protein PHYBLDRAFT_159616 [Phycomyces blakesleeanus NRRL 1555(-)]